MAKPGGLDCFFLSFGQALLSLWPQNFCYAICVVLHSIHKIWTLDCVLCFKDELQELNPAASPYAKVTPTGVDPKLAAQRARIDWDAAAEIQPGAEQKELTDMVPPAVVKKIVYPLPLLS
jgi:hypothetical protein